MIFNGVEKENVSVSNDFTLPARSEIEHIVRPRQKYGSRIAKTKFKELYIPVPVNVYPGLKTLDVMKVELNEWLFQEGDKKLVFNFFPDYYYLARLSGIEWQDYSDRVMKGIITFICQDPFRFGTYKTLNIITTDQTFIIGGQESTSWTSYTRFTVPQSSYTLESNVGKIILKYDFIAGDVLKIDYRTRDVFLNGKDLAVSVQLETVWFELPVGSVQLKASHATEMKYSERFY
ncbi:distal tail protein Dit [Bacillus sp. FSL K6-3431]|uniref:distal tail protein Dit n=1 Tax=Bacillus sp. FSL K6-3431 TaxID=2921500 RepID=UPI0030F8DE89